MYKHFKEPLANEIYTEVWFGRCGFKLQEISSDLTVSKEYSSFVPKAIQ